MKFLKKYNSVSWIFWSLLFLINFGHGAGWSGVYALLINKIGTDKISEFFLYSAIAGFLLNLCLMFYADILKNEKLVQYSFAFFIVVLLAYLFNLNSQNSLSITTFKYLVIGITVLIIAVPSVFIIQTWNLINKVFTPKSGTNVYPFLSTAPLIGSTIGGMMANRLASFLSTQSLIYVWMSAIFLAMIITFVCEKKFSENIEDIQQTNQNTENSTLKSFVKNFKKGFYHFKKSPFAKDLGIVFMSFWLVCTLIDFSYASVLEKVFDNSEKIAAFYGSYTMIVNLAALFVQLFLGSYLIKKIGIRSGFLFLPISQIIGFAVLILIPGLYPIISMMFMQTLIGMSVQSNSCSVSFNIFALEIRGKIRTLLEGVINPLGGVLASLLLIFIKAKCSNEIIHIIVPATGLFFALIWFIATLHIKKSYMQEIDTTLKSSSPLDQKSAQEALDIEAKKI
ncbi:MAG: MFS transporter [Alphaproteobacteria bacterium]|nr:MFS transporter [Alphaproteobacteria bacterium]